MLNAKIFIIFDENALKKNGLYEQYENEIRY